MAKSDARRRFLPPLEAHLKEAGLGHISELADAEVRHHPKGCPFQAWSLGEFLRLSLVVLGEKPALIAPARPAAAVSPARPEPAKAGSLPRGTAAFPIEPKKRKP